MIRRQFIRLITFAGASSLPRLGMAATGGKQTITYHINGFSCVTCAVGLDVMLERKHGVVWSKSCYPEATSTICFNPAVIGEPSLKQAIAEMGFTAELTH